MHSLFHIRIGVNIIRWEVGKDKFFMENNFYKAINTKIR